MDAICAESGNIPSVPGFWTLLSRTATAQEIVVLHDTFFRPLAHVLVRPIAADTKQGDFDMLMTLILLVFLTAPASSPTTTSPNLVSNVIVPRTPTPIVVK
jgi:hypothetical protein